METEFKQGEEIEVSANGKDWHKRILIAKHHDTWICEWCNNPTTFTTWKFGRKIQQPKLVPWESIEEVPLDAWFKREKDFYYKITAIRCDNKVMLGSLLFSLNELFDKFKYSHDIKTWHPCGKESK